MRSCSLVLSLAVILLMLVTMSSFAIAYYSASAYYSAPACSTPAYYSAPACSCSAPACSVETRHTCDCNCIYRQPTQEIQKKDQVALEGIWEIKEVENAYEGLLGIADGMNEGDVKIQVEEKVLVVVQKGKETRIALPESIAMNKIEKKLIKAELKHGRVLYLTFPKAKGTEIEVTWEK